MPYIFYVNPKATSDYRKSYIEMKKTEPTDTSLIANFARMSVPISWIHSAAASILRWNVCPCIAHILQNALPGKRLIWSPTCTWNSVSFSFLRVMTDLLATSTTLYLPQYWQNSCCPMKSWILSKRTSCSKPQGILTGWNNACTRASSFNCVYSYRKEIKLIDFPKLQETPLPMHKFRDSCPVLLCPSYILLFTM